MKKIKLPKRKYSYITRWDEDIFVKLVERVTQLKMSRMEFIRQAVEEKLKGKE